jgi:hypothetical protein
MIKLYCMSQQNVLKANVKPMENEPENLQKYGFWKAGWIICVCMSTCIFVFASAEMFWLCLYFIFFNVALQLSSERAATEDCIYNSVEIQVVSCLCLM